MQDKHYGFNFSVLALPERSDIFMMNMRVYDVVPQALDESPDASANEPVSVIWCAVCRVASALPHVQN